MIDYLKWMFNWKCKHRNLRCIHGDEIIMAGWKRASCWDCPKLFDTLPEYCSYTLEKHNIPKPDAKPSMR
jgi:hypothetical protein